MTKNLRLCQQGNKGNSFKTHLEQNKTAVHNIRRFTVQYIIPKRIHLSLHSAVKFWSTCFRRTDQSKAHQNFKYNGQHLLMTLLLLFCVIWVRMYKNVNGVCKVGLVSIRLLTVSIYLSCEPNQGYSLVFLLNTHEPITYQIRCVSENGVARFHTRPRTVGVHKLYTLVVDVSQSEVDWCWRHKSAVIL